jgi:hypothetical protein
MGAGSEERRGRSLFRPLAVRAIVPAFFALVQPHPCYSANMDDEIPKVYFGVVGDSESPSGTGSEALATDVCKDDLKNVAGMSDDQIQACQHSLTDLLGQLYQELQHSFSVRDAQYQVALDDPHVIPSWSPDDADCINSTMADCKTIVANGATYSHYLIGRYGVEDHLLPGNISKALTIDWEVGRFEQKGDERKLVYYSQATNKNDEKGTTTTYETYLGPRRDSATGYTATVYRRVGPDGNWRSVDPDVAIDDIMSRIVFHLPELADKFELHVECPQIDTVEAILNRTEPIELIPTDAEINAISELALELTGDGSWTLDYLEDSPMRVTRQNYINVFRKKCETPGIEDQSKHTRFMLDECIGSCENQSIPVPADKVPVVVHVSDEAMYSSLTKARLYPDTNKKLKVNKIVRPRTNEVSARKSTSWYVTDVCTDRANWVKSSHDLARFLALNVRNDVGASVPPPGRSDWTCESAASGATSK